MPIEEVAIDKPVDSDSGKGEVTLRKQSADLSVATAAELLAVEVPTITDYQRSENANGEAVLSGTINGETIEQTLPTLGTGLLLFNPETRNWAFVPVVIPAGWQFVELIEGA